MAKYILLSIIFFSWIVIRQTRNQKVFKGKIYQVYNQLKNELSYSGVYGDPFDNAKDFLRSQNLHKNDLEKLETLILINSSNNNLSTQIRTLTATTVITLITLAFGTMFSAVLSGLYSEYVEMSSEKRNIEKIKAIILEMNRIVDSTGWEFFFIFCMLLGGISIWNLLSTDRNQTNVILQKIISDEIRERNNQ